VEFAFHIITLDPCKVTYPTAAVASLVEGLIVKFRASSQFSLNA